MKLTDILLLSLSAAFVIIGTHLTMVEGITLSYPIFMLAVALLFWYKFRKSQQLTNESDGSKSKKIIKESKKK